MTEKELAKIEAAANRDTGYYPPDMREDVLTLVAEVRRLREALSRIGDDGDSIETAIAIARAALRGE